MRVFIATPSVGGVVTTAFANSLVAAINAVAAAGGKWRYLNVDGADVVMARNFLANTFLQDKSCTHLLFIDSDMRVGQPVFAKLIAKNIDFVGALYTERARNWAGCFEKIAAGVAPAKAVAASSSFNVRLPPGQLTVSEGFCEAEAIGFGCVLLKRALLERLAAEKVVAPLASRHVRRAGLKGEAYDFFSELPLEDGDRLSEDFSFCHRARQLDGVKVTAYCGPGIGHVGSYTYEASFTDWLQQLAAQQQ